MTTRHDPPTPPTHTHLIHIQSTTMHTAPMRMRLSQRQLPLLLTRRPANAHHSCSVPYSLNPPHFAPAHSGVCAGCPCGVSNSPPQSRHTQSHLPLCVARRIGRLPVLSPVGRPDSRLPIPMQLPLLPLWDDRILRPPRPTRKGRSVGRRPGGHGEPGNGFELVAAGESRQGRADPAGATPYH